MGATVSISDTEVALADHIEVEIQKDLVGFRGVQVARVEPTSEQSVFFGAPPGEADLVFGLVFRQSEENLKDQGRSRSYYQSVSCYLAIRAF